MIATAFPPRQRHLVPMDFSESARMALRAALRLANQSEDVVLLFYVPGLYERTPQDRAALANPFRVNILETYGRQFLAWAQEDNAAGGRVEVLPLMGLPDASVITQMARRTGCSLIVVVQRDYTFWQRLFAHCPIRSLPLVAPGQVLLAKKTNLKE